MAGTSRSGWAFRSALAASSMAALAACQGAGGSEGAPLCAAPARSPELFLERGKLQVEAFRRLAPALDGFSPERAGAASLPEERFDLDAQAVLPAGASLTAVVREACSSKPGPISAQFPTTEAATPSGLRSHRWPLPRAMSGAELRDLAESDDCLEGLSDESIATVSAAQSTNDPMASKQAHLAMIGADAGYAALASSGALARRPMVIAVIDSGIDLSHPDFRGALWRNARETVNGVDDDRNGYVDDVAGWNFPAKIANPSHQGNWPGWYHGTHVAGLAAAVANNGVGVAGVMGVGARIMPLNVFGDSHSAYNSDTENAIRYAADNGADVINLSLGGSGASASYEQAIAYAIRKGVTVLAAAGNEHRQIGSGYFMTPAGYAPRYVGLLSIGSVDALSWGASVYTNFGPAYVKVAAPGAENSGSRVGLLSTMPGGGYGRLQGTSMATPVSAGAAALAKALLRARGYAGSPAQVEGAIVQSGIARPSLANLFAGGRVLSVRALVEYVGRAYPPRAPGQKEDPSVGKPERGELPSDQAVPCN